MFKSLINLLKKNKNEQTDEVPDGYCPNCWGRQEYGGKFYDYAKNYDSDINSHDPHVGWVQEYANKYLTGIELKKDDENHIHCETCDLTIHDDK